MLTKKDKEEIRKIIQEELKEAFTVEMTMEKRVDDNTGKPVKPEIKNMQFWLPELWANHLWHFEAALRGMQETTDKAKNNSIKSLQGVSAIAHILQAIEEPIKKIANNDTPEAELVE